MNYNEVIITKKKKKNEKNTFLTCGKDFFKTKLDRNIIALLIFKVFNVGFKKPTWEVIWLPITYFFLNISIVSELFILEEKRDHILGPINNSNSVRYCIVLALYVLNA